MKGQVNPFLNTQLMLFFIFLLSKMNMIYFLIKIALINLGVFTPCPVQRKSKTLES